MYYYECVLNILLRPLTLGESQLMRPIDIIDWSQSISNEA